MRKIRKAKEVKTASIKTNKFFDSKEKKIGAIIVATVLILLTAVLLFMESGEGKMTVKNDTDLKLEYIKAFFVNPEGPMSEGVEIPEIAARNSSVIPFGKHKLLYQAANLEVHFKFENYDEIFVDAGYFNDNFSGNVDISFEPTEDDVLRMKVKAQNGLLSSSVIDCNEVFEVDLSEGFVAE